jgi:hypothetical protein
VERHVLARSPRTLPVDRRSIDDYNTYADLPTRAGGPAHYRPTACFGSRLLVVDCRRSSGGACLGDQCFRPEVYRDPAHWAASARGTDLVTLGLALPTLVASMVLSLRGSLRAQLVWLGTLAYLVYAYLFFALGVAFNPLFPVYVAVLSLAVWSLVILLSDLGPERLQHVVSGMPGRATGIYLLVLAVLFLVVWMREIVTAILTGTTPPGVREANLPVNPTHVLDLAFLLPLCAFSGIRVWQHRAIGYLLAGMLVPATTLVAAFSAAAVGFGSMGDLNAVLVPVLLFVLIALIGLLLTVTYLTHIHSVSDGEVVQS